MLSTLNYSHVFCKTNHAIKSVHNSNKIEKVEAKSSRSFGERYESDFSLSAKRRKSHNLRTGEENLLELD